MDCGQPETSWGGPTYGILLCVKCAGRHRSLGTHLSVIKSVSKCMHWEGWGGGVKGRGARGGGNREALSSSEVPECIRLDRKDHARVEWMGFGRVLPRWTRGFVTIGRWILWR